MNKFNVIYIYNNQYAFLLLQITPNSLKPPDFVDLVRIPLNGLWQVPGSICHQYFLLNCFSIKKLSVSGTLVPLLIREPKTRSKSDTFWQNWRCFVFGKKGIFEKNAILWQQFCRRELSFDYALPDRPADYLWGKFVLSGSWLQFSFRIWYQKTKKLLISGLVFTITLNARVNKNTKSELKKTKCFMRNCSRDKDENEKALRIFLSSVVDPDHVGSGLVGSPGSRSGKKLDPYTYCLILLQPTLTSKQFIYQSINLHDSVESFQI